ncbi:MAG: flagellar export chaperone FlgN [Planctomycetes bacterium]|nr:flagellar export chaperone FlgN [Planctomycetota bacterium]
MTTSVDAQTAIDELQVILDKEIEVLDLRRSQMEQISQATVRRDNDLMEKLLGQMEQAIDEHARIDRQLAESRKILAAAYGWPEEQLTLSRLVEQLQGDRRRAIQQKMERILRLTETFRTQHLKTCVLLNECIRINRLLLEGVLPGAAKVATYGQNGSSAWLPAAGVMDRKI